MHTIGYYGDSYCVSREPHSWCVTLARRLGLRITNWGQSGYSHWTTLLELQHKHNTGTLEDVIVICWTEPHRLYHPDKPLSLNSRIPPPHDHLLERARDLYYTHLSHRRQQFLAYKTSIEHFDRGLLRDVGQRRVLQSFSRQDPNNFAHVQLTTGVLMGMPYQFTAGLHHANHMTVEQNHRVSDLFTRAIEK